MSKSVTIGIPVYKRLHCLFRALQSVAAQDYPNIDLLVSDNGLNGTKVNEIVGEWYSRPYRFRQNLMTVKVAEHYNQLIHYKLYPFKVRKGFRETLCSTLLESSHLVVCRRSRNAKSKSSD